jgi:hypothetical protein
MNGFTPFNSPAGVMNGSPLGYGGGGVGFVPDSPGSQQGGFASPGAGAPGFGPSQLAPPGFAAGAGPGWTPPNPTTVATAQRESRLKMIAAGLGLAAAAAGVFAFNTHSQLTAAKSEASKAEATVAQYEQVAPALQACSQAAVELLNAQTQTDVSAAIAALQQNCNFG